MGSEIACTVSVGIECKQLEAPLSSNTPWNSGPWIPIYQNLRVESVTSEIVNPLPEPINYGYLNVSMNLDYYSQIGYRSTRTEYNFASESANFGNTISWVNASRPNSIHTILDPNRPPVDFLLQIYPSLILFMGANNYRLTRLETGTGAATNIVISKSGTYGYFPTPSTPIPSSSQLVPLMPFRIKFRLEFPKITSHYIVRAIEPRAILTVDSFLNTQSAKLQLFVVNGTRPASSDGIELSKPTPVVIEGKNEFEMDSANVSFLKYELGRLFYKDFGSGLRIPMSKSSEYLVGQFIYDGDTSKRSNYFLIDDQCVSYWEDKPNAYTFQDPKTNGNLLVAFLQALSGRLTTLVRP